MSLTPQFGSIIPSQKQELLNDIKLVFNHEMEPWNEHGPNKFHVLVRRNPVNRLTFISLPRFAIRYLLEEQDHRKKLKINIYIWKI